MSVLIEVIKSKSKIRSFAAHVWMSFCGSLAISLSAPLSYKFGFTSVPITFQMHAVLLVSFLLGNKKGPAAVMMFLSYVLMGYSVLGSGATGVAAFFGPTGGYILGYLLSSIAVHMFDASTRLKTLGVFAFGNLTIWCFGYLWLSSFIGLQKAFVLGILPFVVGDVIKTLLITKLVFLPNVHSTLKRLGGII